MRRRPAISQRVGRMYCPRKRSGSMPAEQARPRRTRGVLISIRAMRIITAILDKLLMWGSTVPTLGAFLICMAMCGSGQRTGTQHTVLEHRPILRVQLRAPPVSIGAAPGQYRHVPAFGLPPQHTPAPLHSIGFRVGFQQQ